MIMTKKKKLSIIWMLSAVLVVSLAVFLAMALSRKNVSDMQFEDSADHIELTATDDGPQDKDEKKPEKDSQDDLSDFEFADHEDNEYEADDPGNETTDEENKIREENQLPEIPG